MGAVGASAGSFALSRPLDPWPLVWFPSGLAFAVLLAWGWRGIPAVLLGTGLAVAAELFRFSVAWDSTEIGLAVAGCCCATLLGPALSVFLIRREHAWRERIVTELGSLRFYLIAGIPSGAIAALVWGLAWSQVELVPEGSFALFWGLLVLSQAIGTVLLGTILFFSVRMWSGGELRARVRIVIPLLAGLVAASVFLSYVGRATVAEAREVFEDDATRFRSLFDTSAAAHLERLRSVRSFWDSSQEVESEEFGMFVAQALREGKGLRGLAWIPEVPADEVGTLEAWLRNERGESATLVFLQSTAHRLISSTSETWNGHRYPVIYLEPTEEWGDAIGFNLQVAGAMRELMEVARETDTPWASAPFDLRQKVSVALGIWIPREPLHGKEAREGWIHDLPGFAISFLDGEEWGRAVLSEASGSEAFCFRLSNQGRVDSHAGIKASGILFEDSLPPRLRLPVESMDESFVFGGRTFVLRVTSREPLVASGHLGNLVAAQGATLLMSSLLGILLLSSAGRTRRIEAEVRVRTRELAEAEKRFRQLADNITEAFWTMAPDGSEVEYLSRGVERIWGRPWETLVGPLERWHRAIHPDDRDRVEALFREPDLLRNGFDLEYRIQRPDGAERWIRDRGFPVVDESGKVIRFAGVADDTTELKEYEERLILARGEAQEAGRLLENFFAVSLDLLTLAGMDGYLKRVNPAFTKTLGYSEEELLERPFLEFVHPDDRQDTETALRGLSDGSVVLSFQNRYRHRNGQAVWLEWSAVPHLDEGLIYAAARDVTERRRIEDELKRSNKELEQFAYVASHDLQEPLRMVTSFVQLLERRCGERIGPEGAEYMEHVIGGTERMRRLILALLEWSRVQRKGRPLVPIESNRSLDEALDNLALAIEEAGATICRGNLPRVNADHEQLTRLFQNLVSNALRFCPKASPKVAIEATAVEEGWEFTIEDNGEGIAPEQRENVFEVFQRLHTRAEVPGTGIGLAICRRIVDRHGGRIWIEDGRDGGACFHFTLPAVEENEKKHADIYD